MVDRAFTLMATVTASTKRPPTLVNGKRGDPATNLSSLSCFPLDPVDPELRQRMAINTPHELLQTFTQGGLDIQEGDLLVVGTTEYPIRACAEWHWPEDDANYLHLILEDLKR
jgi:hypothetical protein